MKRNGNKKRKKKKNWALCLCSRTKICDLQLWALKLFAVYICKYTWWYGKKNKENISSMTYPSENRITHTHEVTELINVNMVVVSFSLGLYK